MFNNFFLDSLVVRTIVSFRGNHDQFTISSFMSCTLNSLKLLYLMLVCSNINSNSLCKTRSLCENFWFNKLHDVSQIIPRCKVDFLFHRWFIWHDFNVSLNSFLMNFQKSFLFFCWEELKLNVSVLCSNFSTDIFKIFQSLQVFILWKCKFFQFRMFKNLLERVLMFLNITLWICENPLIKLRKLKFPSWRSRNNVFKKSLVFIFHWVVHNILFMTIWNWIVSDVWKSKEVDMTLWF